PARPLRLAPPLGTPLHRRLLLSAPPPPPAPRLRCHSVRRPHLHPRRPWRLRTPRPLHPHPWVRASRPPPRPVPPAPWERLRQYRFRLRAPSATPSLRPPLLVRYAANPPAVAIRCSWPAASLRPSTPSPTSTSASSGSPR